MGSPEFALPSLQQLMQHHEVSAVVTQPDRRAGRGRKYSPPPVKELAQSHSLLVLQPRTLKDEEITAQIKVLEPEVIVVAAYGQILPPSVLELPPYGCLNVHASLLPRWRGAAPIQAAILHGDEQTGITIMKMDPGLDTGPILSQESTPIEASITAGELSQILADIGGRLLLSTLEKYALGEVTPQPQDDLLATYAPMLRKVDGKLDFSQSTDYLERQVRAFQPWPGSYLTWKDRRLLILKAQAVRPFESQAAGRVFLLDGMPAVGTSDGALVLLQIQPSGKGSMDGAAFIRGTPGFIGADLNHDH
jgi:methionyl-tRNA formyltransferase